MSTYAAFITETYLKKTMPIDENVDAKFLRMAIRDAQEAYIRDIIGSGLYDAICDDINDNGVLGDSDLLTLVNNYIAPALARYVMYEAGDTMTYQITNKGIQTRKSDFSDTADINAITAILQKYKQRADFYAAKITKFLCENSSTYTLFLNPGNQADTVWPSDTKLYSGFAFLNDSNYWISRNLDAPDGNG